MNSNEKFEMFFWEGISPTIFFAPRYPGHKPHTKVDKEKGIACEYDVAVTMRDGVKIYVDIFRPEKEGKYPTLIGWGPFGKHTPYVDATFPDSGVSFSDMSEYCGFEAPDPAYWCPNGYVIINPDPRRFY